MAQWNIIVPVWGERYLDIFCNATFPAICRALRALGDADYNLILYTDAEITVQDVNVEIRPVPAGDRSFGSLSAAHRDALKQARPGEYVVLLTADLVISENSLVSCRDHFIHGTKKLICCAGMRVNDTERPPQSGGGRELMQWGWDHKHAMTKECTWPEGYSYDVSRMYFEQGSEVACRLCLPHPIALLRDSRLVHFAPTIDVNVSMNYSPTETHLVTNPDELAMIELSPPDKEFVMTNSMIKRLRGNLPSLPSLVAIENVRHRMFFSQKIIVCGIGDACGDDEIVMTMLAEFKPQPKPQSRTFRGARKLRR